MTMQYYPDNIRRFVGELPIGKPEVSDGPTGAAPFEFVDPPFPVENAYPAFLEYSRNSGKGVEMVSAAVLLSAGNMEQ